VVPVLGEGVVAAAATTGVARLGVAVAAMGVTAEASGAVAGGGGEMGRWRGR
jgi:hypothetical protein